MITPETASQALSSWLAYLQITPAQLMMEEFRRRKAAGRL